MQRGISFLFLIFFSFLTLTQAQVELKNNQDVYLIGKSISYLISPSDSFSFEDILSQNPKFTPSKVEELNFGFTQDVVWVKFTINNQSDFDDWILDLNMNNLNYLNFYYQEAGEWKEWQTGSLLPFSNKQIKDTGFSFFLNSLPKSVKTYYLSVQTSTGLAIPLRIQRVENFHQYTRGKKSLLWRVFWYFNCNDFV